MNFTKDAILQRLLAAYSGPGAADEGSFAGDVLRACADALAELYSMEIDGLARRAFVSTAVGDWLTAVCADRGLTRREGEKDEALRQRALQKLAALPASGNADHYQAWCAAVPGILRVQVLPCARGAGTVDILAVNAEGKAPEAAVLQAAQAVVNRERPIGADAKVCAPEEVSLQIAASVTLMDGATLAEVQTRFSAALSAFCRDCALRTDTVSFAKVLRLLLECEGVADVSGFTLQGGQSSVKLPARSVAVCGTIALGEVSA